MRRMSMVLLSVLPLGFGAALLVPVLLAPAGCEGGGGCCKQCTNSKPCGDSCIPYDNNCTKTTGCACETEDPPAADQACEFARWNCTELCDLGDWAACKLDDECLDSDDFVQLEDQTEACLAECLAPLDDLGLPNLDQNQLNDAAYNAVANCWLEPDECADRWANCEAAEPE